ncbi:MAG: hypothetical protein CL678_04595 [Bdellovibrionaceae bacterium]|nr:hypothetical protein [Pseudobdellovibrionaceae bacterium]
MSAFGGTSSPHRSAAVAQVDHGEFLLKKSTFNGTLSLGTVFDSNRPWYSDANEFGQGKPRLAFGPTLGLKLTAQTRNDRKVQWRADYSTLLPYYLDEALSTYENFTHDLSLYLNVNPRGLTRYGLKIYSSAWFQNLGSRISDRFYYSPSSLKVEMRPYLQSRIVGRLYFKVEGALGYNRSFADLETVSRDFLGSGLYLGGQVSLLQLSGSRFWKPSTYIKIEDMRAQGVFNANQVVEWNINNVIQLTPSFSLTPGFTYSFVRYDQIQPDQRIDDIYYTNLQFFLAPSIKWNLGGAIGYKARNASLQPEIYTYDQWIGNLTLGIPF